MKKVLFGILLLSLIVFIGCEENQTVIGYAAKCSAQGGNWIESAQECESISKESCDAIGGTFNECASACRNDPTAEICTMQCIQVCQFNIVGGDKDAHGCIPSAGYSWCEAKQKCLRPWEENCTTVTSCASDEWLCSLTNACVKKGEICSNGLPGGSVDEHGCNPTAGYSYCPATDKCIRSWEEDCAIGGTALGDQCYASGGKWISSANECEGISEQQCTKLGGNFNECASACRNDPTAEVCTMQCIQVCKFNSTVHMCTAEESQAHACTMIYNPVCGKIVLNMGKTLYQTFGNGCSACAAMKVVSYTTGECPADKTTDMCSDGKGNYMTLEEAKVIAEASECGKNLTIGCTCPSGYRKDGDFCNPNCYYSTPKCLAPSIQCEKTYQCNEGTGTYWINLNLNKTGCNPACVINVATKAAEINWRCTGLIN